MTSSKLTVVALSLVWLAALAPSTAFAEEGDSSGPIIKRAKKKTVSSSGSAAQSSTRRVVTTETYVDKDGRKRKRKVARTYHIDSTPRANGSLNVYPQDNVYQTRGPVYRRPVHRPTQVVVVENDPYDPPPERVEAQSVAPNQPQRRPLATDGSQRPEDYVVRRRNRIYVGASVAWGGLIGDMRANSTVFHGINYGIVGGWGMHFFAVEAQLEGSHHTLPASSGFSPDLSIFQGTINLKGFYPIGMFEPYLYAGIGAAVYHPDPAIEKKDYYDWGTVLNIGIGFQLRFNPIVVALEYGHRVYDFGGETDTEEALRMDQMTGRLSFLYYF